MANGFRVVLSCKKQKRTQRAGKLYTLFLGYGEKEEELLDEHDDIQLLLGFETSAETTLTDRILETVELGALGRSLPKTYETPPKLSPCMTKFEKLEDGYVHMLEDIRMQESSTKRGQV